ncbi:hypothetical protein OUZ56_000740 [Daphnia magna]|uniref:Carboxylesterase type B domain-containing protein n=1 Tax=Daphnia magna TaxID=35525 RepID=A0ABR0A0N0_9CRUS|nr:hypothetical protein OUZ56_000740 [Daphnia magna]
MACPNVRELLFNLYFVYNINISLKSVFEIHGANLPHYHCQLTPLVGHSSLLLASGGPEDYIVSYTIYVEFASLFYTAVFNFFLFCLFLLSDAEALHWIQENIQEFGGDPARVTLVGFGAGAACVHFLMTSPAVKHYEV